MSEQWYPGKAKTQKVQITNTFSGATQDMTDLVFEISVQSSMYDYYSFCEIQVFDALNFLSNFPVESGNKIDITIQYENSTQDLSFIVSKISYIEQIDKERTYNIECITELGFKAMSTRFSSAYVGSSSGMAKQIFDEYGGGKVGLWEDSKGFRWFISPNWTPTKAISYLAAESISQDGKNRFVFFQNNKQEFYFCPVETLGQMGPAIKYKYNQYTTDQERENFDPGKIMTTPYELAHLDEYNWLDAVNQGALSAEIIQTDVTKKTLNYWKFNYWEQFDQNFHLNDKPLWNYQEVTPGKIGLRNHFNQYDFNNDYMLEDDSISRPSNVVAGQTIELTVTGNDFIDTGMVIELEVPPPEPNATLRGGMRSKTDVSFSGLYYVLGTRDVYYKNRGEKVTSLTCVKESLVESDA